MFQSLYIISDITWINVKAINQHCVHHYSTLWMQCTNAWKICASWTWYEWMEMGRLSWRDNVFFLSIVNLLYNNIIQDTSGVCLHIISNNEPCFPIVSGRSPAFFSINLFSFIYVFICRHFPTVLCFFLVYRLPYPSAHKVSAFYVTWKVPIFKIFIFISFEWYTWTL